MLGSGYEFGFGYSVGRYRIGYRSALRNATCYPYPNAESRSTCSTEIVQRPLITHHLGDDLDPERRHLPRLAAVDHLE